MSKTKKWSIAGISLIGAGVLICLTAFAALGGDLHQLNTVSFLSNTYKISEDFDSIRIEADIEDISFTRSDDESCKVICYEREDVPHHVWVENDTLMITGNRKQKRNFLFFITESPTITVCLPKDSYQALTIESGTSDTVIPKEFSFERMNVSLSTGDVTCFASAEKTISVKTDTGNITLSGVSAAAMELTSDTGELSLSGAKITEALKLESDTGNIVLNHVSCYTLICGTDTSDVLLTDVIADGAFRLESYTGDITFNGCDASEIYAKTETGDITGTLLGEKLFLTETDTGEIRVPKTVTGDRCELITDTGDIIIELK